MSVREEEKTFNIYGICKNIQFYAGQTGGKHRNVKLHLHNPETDIINIVTIWESMYDKLKNNFTEGKTYSFKNLKKGTYNDYWKRQSFNFSSQSFYQELSGPDTEPGPKPGPEPESVQQYLQEVESQGKLGIIIRDYRGYPEKAFVVIKRSKNYNTVEIGLEIGLDQKSDPDKVVDELITALDYKLRKKLEAGLFSNK